MTEDEAKTKWCPFVRHAVVSSGLAGGSPMVSINRPTANGPQDQQLNCVASGCMAWRWGRVEGEVMAATVDHVASVSPGSVSFSPARGGGYCGLAGNGR